MISSKNNKQYTIRIESSCYSEHSQPSGVGHFSLRIRDALLQSKRFTLDETAGPFNTTTLNKAYRKALIHTGLRHILGIDPAKPRVDVMLFPNFSNYGSRKATLTAAIIHDLAYIDFPEHIEKKNLAHLKKSVPQTLDETDIIITPSTFIKQQIIKKFSIDQKRICVLPIPVSADYTTISKTNIYTRYSIPTKKYIYSIGNLDPRKNIISLLKAYDRLPADTKEEYSLILAGGRGWKNENIIDAIATYQKTSPNIQHIGYIDQKDAGNLMKSAYCHVAPSLYEGFGMTLVEAMSVCTPVIASNIEPHKEISNGTLTLFDISDPDALYNELHAIINKKPSPATLKKALTQSKSISWDNNITLLHKKITDTL